MKRSRQSKSIEPVVDPGLADDIFGEVPPRPNGDVNYDKRERDFLFPRMPGPFRPALIRKLPVEVLRARYIQVLSATMGNHSMGLFYCDWTQDQFEAALNAKFRKQIALARSMLADRAQFILHKTMGLIRSADDDEGSRTMNPTVTSAMAKVVDSLRSNEMIRESASRGFKLVVEGLDRTKTAPPQEPPAP